MRSLEMYLPFGHAFAPDDLLLDYVLGLVMQMWVIMELTTQTLMVRSSCTAPSVFYVHCTFPSMCTTRVPNGWRIHKAAIMRTWTYSTASPFIALQPRYKEIEIILGQILWFCKNNSNALLKDGFVKASWPLQRPLMTTYIDTYKGLFQQLPNAIRMMSELAKPALVGSLNPLNSDPSISAL